jgi:hypothetical protein
MLDPLPRLPILTQAYDAAYAACSREIAHLSPRRQSDEVLRHVARFCLAQVGRPCDDIAEAKLVGVLAGAAADPFALTQLIAAINAESGDADFPAASLDPRGRHGWTAAIHAGMPRIIHKPPWQQSTDELLAELRVYTEGLNGERLHAQLAANIENRAGGNFIVPDNGTDPRPARMMPVSIAAGYILAFEQLIRDLETALEEERRSQYAER